jgi:hypothetical protein
MHALCHGDELLNRTTEFRAGGRSGGCVLFSLYVAPGLLGSEFSARRPYGVIEAISHAVRILRLRTNSTAMSTDGLQTRVGHRRAELIQTSPSIPAIYYHSAL